MKYIWYYLITGMIVASATAPIIAGIGQYLTLIGWCVGVVIWPYYLYELVRIFIL